jgi:hypothetical protein
VVSFLALRDLVRAIGYSSATASVFPAIIDTAVAVSSLMLVALGDKPAGRTRAVTMPANPQTPAMQRVGQRSAHSAKAKVTGCPTRASVTRSNRFESWRSRAMLPVTHVPTARSRPVV